MSILINLLAALNTCYCQQIINNLESYTINNGLSDGTISSVLQDKRGYLWFGTAWGLNRYDARYFKNFIRTGDNNLIDANVRSLAEDSIGNIWIGTSNGVSRFNPYTNSFTNIHGGQSIVYIDKQKNTWIAEKNLKLLNKDGKTFRHFNLELYGKDTRQNKFILSMLDDSKGRLWIATSYGIKLFSRKTYTWKSYHFDEARTSERVLNACTSLFEDSQGNIWCGTWGGGILKYNSAHDKFEPYLLPSLLSNIIYCINEVELKQKKYIVIGTEDGLGIFSTDSITGKNLKPLQILKQGNDNNSLLSNVVTTLIVDREQSLWIGGSNGVQKADMHQQGVQWINMPRNDKPVFLVLKDIRKPSDLVYITTQQGWSKMSLKNFQITPFVLPDKHKELLSNINDYVITKTGYWFTSQKGFGFFNPNNLEVSDLSNKIDNDNEVRTGRVTIDKYGRIWFAVYRNGIRIYDPVTKRIIKLFSDSMPESLKGKSVFGLKSDKGYAWLSSDYKIFRINVNDLSYSVHNNYTDSAEAAHNRRLITNSIHIDKQKRILLIGQQQVLVFKDNRVQQLFPSKGVADFLIEEVSEDSTGKFWIKTNRGFYKVSPDFKNWKSLSGETGITLSTEINEIFHSDNNDVILTSLGKVLILNQKDLIKSSQPQIQITSLSAGDTTYAFPVLQKSNISVAYKNSIEVELSVLNFLNEKENRIFYKMKGWDKDWKEVDKGYLIRYEQLPPGKYELLAKAMSASGIESKEVVLLFKVDPPFWQTWWFILLLSLATSAIIYLMYRYRVNEIIRQERLRSKIASDLHDDIGATLSSISFYSETLKQQTQKQMPQLLPLLDKIGATSREMVSNMSDIVWAINPKNDDVDHLASKIQLNAAELCALKNVSLTFNCQPSVFHLKLSMEQRRNIYLIYKEAINNSLKYSQSALLQITIEEENKKLILLIQDNGIGFEPDHHEGNGLKNMKNRAADIKGNLTITKHNNIGTSIRLQIPLT
ncbi:MAG TPA: two-component regulator propeller domain-containing protein [Segetibacter sp.]